MTEENKTKIAELLRSYERKKMVGSRQYRMLKAYFESEVGIPWEEYGKRSEE